GGRKVAGDQLVGGPRGDDLAAEDLDVVVGHDHHARAGRHRGHRRALATEVVVVVGDDAVVEHARGVPGLRQVGHVEHQDAPGIPGGDVVVHVRADAVLDLDPGHVLLGAVAAHHHVLRLADVDAGVGGADHHRVLDQHVLRLHRVQAVGAVVGVRTVGPLHAHAADGDVLALVDLQAVALAVLDGEVLQGEVVGIDDQALGTAALALEAEDGLVHARAADGHAVHAQAE